MGVQSITSVWKCECSSENPLRFRKCRTCGRTMPVSVANNIYNEVLKEQKAFIDIEKQEEAKRRCLKIGGFLEKAKTATVLITVVLFVVLNAGRFYLDRSNISECARERLEMNGLKSIPVAGEALLTDIKNKTNDVDKGLAAKMRESEKKIDHEKIKKIKKKIK